MKATRGYKTELDLNHEQRTACLKHAGCARFAYNWGLARAIAAYRVTDKRPNAFQLHRELNALKKKDFPWMYEVSKCAMQEALRDLDKAYKHFFRRLALKKARTMRSLLSKTCTSLPCLKTTSWLKRSPRATLVKSEDS